MGAKFSSEIQESKDNRGTDLELRNAEKLKTKTITALLEGLSTELPQLQALTVANSKIKTLPTEFWQSLSALEALTSLNLEDNNISSLPEEAATRNANLRDLSLSGNKIPEFQTKVFSRLSGLRTLDLSRNCIKKVAGDLTGSSISALNLSTNELPEISLSLCYLLHLQEMDLSHNSIVTIPSSINKLRNLSRLKISHNSITIVPPELGDLINLIYLDLSSNSLTSLPQEMSRLTGLRLLSLQHCRFTSFPAVITSMECLETLRLNDNRLTSIPQSIENMHSLVEFHLQENLLTTLPAEMGQLTSLRRLYVEFNKIANLPSQLSGMRGLISFQLHHNDLNAQPNFLKNLRSLVRFNMDSNHMDDSEYHKSELFSLIAEKEAALSVPVRIRTSNLQATKSDSESGFTRLKGGHTLRQNSRSLVSIQEILGKEAREEALPFRSPSNRKSTTGSDSGQMTITAFLSPEIHTSVHPDASTSSSPEGSLSEKNSMSPSGRKTTTLSVDLAMEYGRSLRHEAFGTMRVEGAPNYSKFREAYEQMIEEQSYTKDRQDVMYKLNNEQKWALAKDFKPWLPLMMKQEGSRKSRAFGATMKGKNRPGDFVGVLQKGRTSREDLTHLLSALRLNSDSFCLLFIEAGGLNYLLRLLDSKSFLNTSLEQSSTSNEAITIEALRCMCTLLEQCGSVVLTCSDAISSLGLHYDSTSSEISIIVLRIFQELCTLSLIGRELVMNAIRHHHRLKWRDEKTRPNLLSTIVELFSNAVKAKNASSSNTILAVINKVVSGEPELEERFDMRNSLINLGVLHMFTSIKQFDYIPSDTDKLRQQVDTFESEMLDDEEDMIEKYGKMIVLARKQKDTLKEGNFVFVTESGKSDTFSFLPAILPYEPDTRVSTLMEETQSCFDVLQSTKIEYGLFIPQDTASKGLDSPLFNLIFSSKRSMFVMLVSIILSSKMEPLPNTQQWTAGE
ncbi:hypothetical protein PROFUN_15378 [Planoprotostelium fungivorum]|uniref:GBD/FH3 domain-containing protein n=1 Tax=Planoprotostelium fungivorum TaxID=1890364 RepID=A0A2P6MWR9_9EUKA|nr:hypothetical protein PROFUN_15378 [Planoprotostelium fungivorum]